MADAHPGLAGIRLCFGGNVFGWTIDRDQSFAVLDAYYEGGGRMIDSAEGYSSWVPGNKGGESETIIGAWLESRGVRSDMKIATKTGMGGPPGALAPEKVAAALDASLERLRTDYVDLYYAHRDEPQTPVDTVVAGFDALVKAGKARELGASNFTAERLALSLDSAARQGLAAYTVLQPGYNLVWRGEFPRELHQLAADRGLAVLPYYALAAGFLTGKYRSPEDLTGARGGSARMFADAGWRALPVLGEVAQETGATMGEVALAWLNAQPAIYAPVASGTSVQQVEQLCAAAKLELSADQLARLTAVSVDAGL
ncbi:aldo/keto reductase [Phenylobacterium sp. LjRoot225]|uniref:aldo/keto reductase n=1 Tax=Phenylobacterium sp. LjRoot225 TaxID=3342285 RepID=UPI003ECC494B